MRSVMTLAGKDLRVLLTSPLFYVIAGMSTLLWSYTYIRMIVDYGKNAGMQAGQSLQNVVFMGHISQCNLLFIFVLPALTMRLLAEEKRLRTYDLLLTAPVSATQIAVGKFLAGWGTAAVLILISFIYPISTRLFAEFPVGPLVAAYVGLLLVSGVYVAVGLFASSLSESIMLSVVLGLIFNIMLWFLPQGAGEGHVWSPVLEYMSIGQHFLSFIMGAIKLNATVFFASLIGVFVFLTQRVIESSRWR